MDDELTLSLPCVTCGYELRGLRADGVCPECGTAIERSLRGDLLTAADPNWLGTIARGQRFISRGMFVAAVCMFIPILLLLLFMITTALKPGLPRWIEDTTTVVVGLFVLGVPLALCIIAVGIFFLTKQEGRLIEHEPISSARNFARWSVLLSIASLIGLLAIRNMSLTGMSIVTFEIALRLAFIAAITAAALSLLTYLEMLLRRIPDDALVKETIKERRFLRWAIPAAGLYLLMGRILLTGMAGPGGAVVGIVGGIFSCVGFIAALGLIASVVRLTGLMRRCADRLQLCQVIAKETDSRLS